jgi:hypothetical protein
VSAPYRFRVGGDQDPREAARDNRRRFGQDPPMKTRNFLAGCGAAGALVAAAMAVTAPPASEKPSREDLAKIHGRIQIVDSFPDYKVKVVTSFPDLRVQTVTSFPDAPGRWQIVDSFPDFKVQFVESFPDFTIEYVTSFPGVP